MSACEIKLEAANNMPVGSVGVFYPQCNPDGTYQAMQCNQSSGWCWCVDINTGEQLDWETRDKSTLACGKFCKFYALTFVVSFCLCFHKGL